MNRGSTLERAEVLETLHFQQLSVGGALGGCAEQNKFVGFLV